MKATKNVGVVLSLGLAVAGCDQEATPEAVVDDIMADVQERTLDPELCDEVFTFDYQLPVGDGVYLHVVEKFTPKSVLRVDRRALLMLTGTLVTHDQYNAEIDGVPNINALEEAARAGYFAFAVTYEGYEGSSIPADGKTVTAERILDQLGVVVELIRFFRGVPEVDILGASLGSSLAIALGGTYSPIDPDHVGKIILTSKVYQEVTPLFEQVFFSPEVQELLLNAPDGYVQTGPENYGLIISEVEPEVAQWAAQTWPGVYAVGPTLEGFDLPIFDAEAGRAPALQFWGDADLITPYSDVEAFQADYGGPVSLSVIPGAGHAVSLEPSRDVFFEQSFDFLDADRDTSFLACGD